MSRRRLPLPQVPLRLHEGQRQGGRARAASRRCRLQRLTTHMRGMRKGRPQDGELLAQLSHRLQGPAECSCARDSLEACVTSLPWRLGRCRRPDPASNQCRRPRKAARALSAHRGEHRNVLLRERRYYLELGRTLWPDYWETADDPYCLPQARTLWNHHTAALRPPQARSRFS